MASTPETATTLEGLQMEVDVIERKFETYGDQWKPGDDFLKLLGAEHQIAKAKALSEVKELTEGEQMTEETADALEQSVTNLEYPRAAALDRVAQHQKALAELEARHLELKRMDEEEDRNKTPQKGDLRGRELGEAFNASLSAQNRVKTAIGNYGRAAEAFPEVERPPKPEPVRSKLNWHTADEVGAGNVEVTDVPNPATRSTVEEVYDGEPIVTKAGSYEELKDVTLENMTEVIEAQQVAYLKLLDVLKEMSFDTEKATTDDLINLATIQYYSARYRRDQGVSPEERIKLTDEIQTFALALRLLQARKDLEEMIPRYPRLKQK